jgi:hypothetical protein
VIALCRRPVFGFEDEQSEMNEDEGGIEYDRHNMNQYYHVEEVLAMVDIANDGESN